MMSFDLLIKNGLLIDGTGNPWFKADLGIKDGKITDIGDLKSVETDRYIDAKDLFVSPGFIDIHGHSDATIMFANRCESKITQGVTTECVGNCGSSAWPVTEKNIELVHKRLSRTAPINVDWSTFGEY
ncbi:unnamed protein product, partial [marine sediment metagenome]